MEQQRVDDETDAELLRQLREGNFVRAWSEIERHYGPMMMATANAKLGFAEIDAGAGSIGAWSANDVVQQVIVELMKRGPALADSINGSLGAYLRGAVRNRVKTAFDKRRERPIDADVVAERGGDRDFTNAVVENEMVTAALQSLNERERHVVVETIMYLRSNADVGRELGLTGQGVGKIKERALQQMTEALGGERA